MKFSFFKKISMFGLKFLIFRKRGFKLLLTLDFERSVVSVKDFIFFLEFFVVSTVLKLLISLFFTFLALKSFNVSVSFLNHFGLFVKLSSKTFKQEFFFLHEILKTESFMGANINFFVKSVVLKN